jgi:hypothetical protein
MLSFMGARWARDSEECPSKFLHTLALTPYLLGKRVRSHEMSSSVLLDYFGTNPILFEARGLETTK